MSDDRPLDPLETGGFDLLGWGFEPPPEAGAVPEGWPGAGVSMIPPMAGGAPGPGWSDIWDTIQDIVTAPWELAKKVGEVALALWDAIWTGIGGALRWLYDWLEDWASDLYSWVYNNLAAIMTTITTWVQWAKERLWDRIGEVWEWVYGAAGWVYESLWHRIGEAWGWVWGAAEWLKARMWEARDWVRDRVYDAAGWVRERVEEYGEGLFYHIWQSANWIVRETLTPIMGAAESVADVFRDAFDLIGGAVMDGLEILGGAIRDALEWVFTSAFEPLVDIIERKLAIPGKLMRGEYRDLGDLIDDVVDPPAAAIGGLAGPVILAVVIALVVSAIMSLLMEPLSEPHVQTIRAGVGATLLSRLDLQEARWRGLPVDVDDQLARYGYNEGNRGAIAEIDKRIPGPGDLVRFAVREAFDESLARELGYVTPLPGEFGEWLARQGYDEVWANRFWWSHWDLPSVTQGFEMFHRLRDDFTEDELRTLLRVLDIPPIWHDRFIRIAYQPLTRVDVRRMFTLGVLDEDGVRSAYRDIGYSPEDADRMTEFTKRFSAPDEDGELKEFRDMAQTTIRQGYRRHVLTRDEALDKLVEAGYSEDVADFLLTIDDVQMGLRPDLDADVDIRELTTGIIRSAYRDRIWTRDQAQGELEVLGYLPGSADLILSLEDVSQERELTELEIGVIREEFRANIIDRGQALTELNALGIAPERRDLLLRRWDLYKIEDPRRLTLAQLQRAFREELLSEVELLDRLLGSGYTQPDAELLVDMTDVAPEKRERRLSVSQLQKSFKVDLLTDAELLERFLALGYPQADAELLVNITDPDPERQLRRLSVSQLSKAFKAQLLTEAQFLDELLALGYSQRDAGFLISLAGGGAVA